MSDLKEKFQNFVGQRIKNPERVTADICDVSSGIDNIAFDEGLSVVFHMADGKTYGFQDPGNQVDVEVDSSLTIQSIELN